MTPEFNLLAVSLLIALFLFWKLDFIATLLTLKNLEPKLPEEFRGVWDDAKYAKAQDYERAQAKFGILSSITSLTIFLVFWFMGGFGWLDGVARGMGHGPIVTGLIFIGLMSVSYTHLTLPTTPYV